MTTYRERREARAERLRDWADSRDRKAATAEAAARRTADIIPLGQPMLTDHYSYRGDRNRRDRMTANFAKAYEHSAKADEMRRRADSIETAADRAIYSDDPDALDRLREKLADLEAERDRIKRYNATCRKGAPDLSILDDRQRADLASVQRHTPYNSKGGAMPAYALSNLSGNIKRTRDRIAQLGGAR